jgi:transaldolase
MKLDLAAADLEEIAAVFANCDFPREVIVAGVGHPRHVLEAARLGADIAAVPYAVPQKLVRHPLSDKGVERFLDDWRKVKG